MKGKKGLLQLDYEYRDILKFTEDRGEKTDAE